MRKLKPIYISILTFAVLFVFSCKKKSSDNPYDNWTVPTKGPVIDDKPLDPNSIQGLHKNIFKPTCANSGCHDGNFEPDFRSVESSYNSLINRLATNYDPQNTGITKRVLPGNAAASMLLHRINTFIPGTQGKMPLSLDPGSDWPDKKGEYLQNISNWINDGAKDQFGNTAASLDFSPQLGGLIVFADGSSTPLPRSGYSPIVVPSGTSSIKIMVSYLDDKTAVNQFGTSTINFSLNPENFSNPEQALSKENSAFSFKGYSLPSVDYWHSITIPVSQLGVANDVIWIRTNTTDNVNPAVYIPSTDASFNTKKYFAIRIN